MKLTFAYSPCPNDTFMFEPIISGRIDTEGLRFEVSLADVEELNRSAFDERYDITKLSFNAFTSLTDRYQLLNSGSALGRNCGPLLISRSDMSDTEVSNARIAIPGKNTTANFLLSYAYPTIREKKELLFSDIEAAILDGSVDAGVIIHENRFTFQDRGLVKIRDLGEHWEATTGYPIPLGGIVTRRRFTEDLKKKIDRVIARSVAYALAHPESGTEYITCHAQEMEPSVMQSHINLYVNEYSANIGTEGRASVEHLLANHPQKSIGGYHTPIFVSQNSAAPETTFLTAGYWSSRYANEITGWDVGEITTPIKEYVDGLADKSIKILIPGAGNSHEAEYLYRQGFTNVHVCDFARAPLDNLKRRCPSFPTAHLIHGDFFELRESYDLILEQTFFCALDPSLRRRYVEKMQSLLSPDGSIVGVMFDTVFPFQGPPFGGTSVAYRKLFETHFSKISIEPCHNSIPPRLGSEVFIRIGK